MMKYVVTLMALLLTPISTTHVAMNHQYAMVFFFESTCHYCHLFAPKMQQLTQDTQLPTYAFSIDNKGMPGFDIPIPVTPEIGQKFFQANNGKAVLPATFLMNVNSQKFTRISVGDIPYSQLSQSVINALNDPKVREALQ
ncbi:type-F conjugative transfer system pilin assembly thiol-disulfide isomerase TrbB [Vibrio genomosp. F6]|nr:type-F conjugative transfer system pilin assembly thiol-disulfide isomerase TrbB [Vibrio genomosp. F6]